MSVLDFFRRFPEPVGAQRRGVQAVGVDGSPVWSVYDLVGLRFEQDMEVGTREEKGALWEVKTTPFNFASPHAYDFETSTRTTYSTATCPRLLQMIRLCASHSAFGLPDFIRRTLLENLSSRCRR